MSQRERYWRGVIRRHARSGLTVAEFCQREGVSTAAFYSWRKRLREQAGSGTGNRKRDGPERFLSGYEGYLQADAYGGYDGIYLRSKGGIIEVACWAHARRKWWEAKTTDPRRAHEALGYIGRLYQLEEAVRDATAEERWALRQEHALPILETFREWMDGEHLQVLPKSPLGQALGYTLNQWTALSHRQPVTRKEPHSDGFGAVQRDRTEAGFCVFREQNCDPCPGGA